MVGATGRRKPFHFKKDQAEYTMKPEGHGSKPLFSKKGASQTLSNEFFFYVWSRLQSFVVAAMRD